MLYYVNYADGFLVVESGPARFVRRATPFETWEAADKAAKEHGLTCYAILRG